MWTVLLGTSLCQMWLQYLAGCGALLELQNTTHGQKPTRQPTCWSFRCSWSIACQCCSNYIFIFDLTPSFNGFGKDNCKMRPESLKFWNLLLHILIRGFTVCFLWVIWGKNWIVMKGPGCAHNKWNKWNECNGFYKQSIHFVTVMNDVFRYCEQCGTIFMIVVKKILRYKNTLPLWILTSMQH